MKNILIIGSNSGIAKALIKQLLKEKNNVFAISKQEDSFIHENYTSFQTDILSEALPEKVTASEIDGFVYFPGTINLKPFKSIKEDTFRSDLEINLLGAIKSLQQIEKQLTENSSVLLFSSVAAQTGMPFHASVAASKGAVEGLTGALAAEWAPKVRVNCIAPSLTETPLASRFLKTQKQKEAMQQRHPMKTYGQPIDIASMANFLLSEKSRWITGQVIGIDGGLSTIKQ